MAKIRIDGETYEADPANNLLQECLSRGLDLPYFCWHPCMGSVGACRQCAVKQYKDADDTEGVLVMACMTAAADGTRISIEDAEAKAFRAQVIESLMLSHPHDCPVCEEGGECHLQDMTLMSGHNYRRYGGSKVTHRNQYLGPFINHEMNRCIACYRCVRFYNDYAGGTDLSAQACHHHVYFGRYQDGPLENEFSGNLVEVCPTGVFTDKVFSAAYTRKWDLQTAPSVCSGCAVGCNTAPGERDGSLRRIVNRYNSEVNGYFLCDRGRFGAGYVNSAERIMQPLHQTNTDEKQPSAAPISGDEAAQLINRLKGEAASGSVIGIGSPRAGNEANFALREFVGAENFYAGCSDGDFEAARLSLIALQDPAIHVPSVKEAEEADAVLILGEDLTHTAPRLALALRQSVRGRALALADEHGIPRWQDAAVRDLAQHRRSPLVIVGCHSNRLEDVAEDFLQLPPDDIAAFGFALARVIDGGAAEKEGVGGMNPQQLKKVADVLKGARRPLTVAGSGLARPEIIRAAAAVTRSLSRRNERPAWLCPLPHEVNTMGMALLTRPENTLSAALQRLGTQEAKHLLVLENDLFRRAAGSAVEAALKSVETLVVLEQLPTATTVKADYILPVTSFNEHSATYINYEGRAQLSLQLQQPRTESDSHAGPRPSWSWLQPGRGFDDTVRACAAACTELAPLAGLLPDPAATVAGMKLPRQPHRYSGRTAMRAHINVHEPKQTEDKESVLAFSMEGVPPQVDSNLIASSWAPNWNSNQSISKFQDEVGGKMQQGHPGTLLFAGTEGQSDHRSPLEGEQAKQGRQPEVAPWGDQTPAMNQGYGRQEEAGDGLQLAPLQRIFGSDELSARSPAIQERMTGPFIAVAAAEAARLNLSEGEQVTLNGGPTLQLHLQPRIPEGVAAVYPSANATGAAEVDLFTLGSRVSLKKVKPAPAAAAMQDKQDAHDPQDTTEEPRQ